MDLLEGRPPADLMGRVPLHYAALFGDLAGAQRALDDRVDVNIEDLDGQTPLHYAAQGCAIHVAELLLDRGATVDPADHDGNTPLWCATMRTRGDGDVVRLLLARGADAHRDNAAGRSPASLAAAFGSAAPWTIRSV